MTKTIYLFRHGETDFNRQGIIQGGGVDSSLNDTGRQQAQAFFRHYHAAGFEIALTSSLRRTHETIRPFVEQGLPWQKILEIDEMNWGILEGQHSTPERIALYREMVRKWQDGNLSARIPGGESALDLASRLSRFIGHLKERPEKNLLVCSHGRAMRCLVCLMKEEPIGEMEKYKHDNTGLYKIRLDGNRFLFELENNTDHLALFDWNAKVE